MLIITARKVYGATLFYPANETALAFSEALGTKTLTLHALRCAERMGHAIRLDGRGTLADLLGVSTAEQSSADPFGNGGKPSLDRFNSFRE